jgi:hypothetical protein
MPNDTNGPIEDSNLRILQERKLRREDEKLAAEIRELNRPWWQKAGYLGVLAPSTLALVTLLIGVYTGFFEKKRLENDIKQLKTEKENSEAQIDSLHDSVKVIIKFADSLSGIVEGERKQRTTVEELLLGQKNESKKKISELQDRLAANPRDKDKLNGLLAESHKESDRIDSSKIDLAKGFPVIVDISGHLPWYKDRNAQGPMFKWPSAIHGANFGNQIGKILFNFTKWYGPPPGGFPEDWVAEVSAIDTLEFPRDLISYWSDSLIALEGLPEGSELSHHLYDCTRSGAECNFQVQVVTAPKKSSWK